MKIGDLITFSYPAIHKQGTKAHDKQPKVLVLHPEYPGPGGGYATGNITVHGLNFNYLTNNEINMVRMILSPKFQLQHKASLTRRDPNLVKEFDEIINKAGATMITSPEQFYNVAIYPFIKKRGGDPYRRYVRSKMKNVRIVEPYEVLYGHEKDNIFKKFARRLAPMRGPRIMPNRGIGFKK